METFSALLALCVGNSPVTGEFPSQRPVTRSFDVFFDLRLNKRWSKQPWGWWFEAPSCSLWRHRNDYMKYMFPLINWVEVFLQNQNEYYTKRWIYPTAFVIIDNIIMFICVPKLCWVIKRINCDSGVQPPSNCNITKVPRAKWVAQSCWCICFDLYWHTHSQLLMKCLSDATRMNTEPYDITMTWDVHWGISNHPHPTVCLTTPSG